jgi:hypothetical protein
MFSLSKQCILLLNHPQTQVSRNVGKLWHVLICAYLNVSKDKNMINICLNQSKFACRYAAHFQWRLTTNT